MSEEWISFEAATDLVRSRLNSSVGRAQAIVRSALASGEIRSSERWVPLEDDDLVVLVDDYFLEVDPVPGYLAMVQAANHPKAVTSPIRNGVNGREKQMPVFSVYDLVGWLDRQSPSTTSAPKARTRRTAEKAGRARRAALAIWGEGGPPSSMNNKSIAREVWDWLKRHDEPQDISEKVIRRAVGRK